MKKCILVLTILLFAGATFAQSIVQSGTFFYSKDQNKGNYTLHENQGKRLVEFEVNFNKPFDKKPKVVLMTTLLDAERSTQVRYNVKATGISRDGFVLLAEVWGDTQFNAIGGYWLAHTEE
jgi:hypothetical protein